MPNVIIKGVGSCIPDRVVPNSEFLNHVFYQPDGTPYPDENDVIIRKFEKITGIKERRYAAPGQKASDLGAIAAERALAHAGISGDDLGLYHFRSQLW